MASGPLAGNDICLGRSDDGHRVGWLGESPCLFPPAEALKGVMDACAPFLIGEDPFDHERIYKRF
jgi:L-alanine-DL-glutamate epimerase-like enolase superfamily enzyme